MHLIGTYAAPVGSTLHSMNHYFGSFSLPPYILQPLPGIWAKRIRKVLCSQLAKPGCHSATIITILLNSIKDTGLFSFKAVSNLSLDLNMLPYSFTSISLLLSLGYSWEPTRTWKGISFPSPPLFILSLSWNPPFLLSSLLIKVANLQVRHGNQEWHQI